MLEDMKEDKTSVIFKKVEKVAKDCEYCSKHPKHLLYHDGIYAKIIADNVRICTDGSIMNLYAKINHCPKCGRKLTEE